MLRDGDRGAHRDSDERRGRQVQGAVLLAFKPAEHHGAEQSRRLRDEDRGGEIARRHGRKSKALHMNAGRDSRSARARRSDARPDARGVTAAYESDSPNRGSVARFNLRREGLSAYLTVVVLQEIL